VVNSYHRPKVRGQGRGLKFDDRKAHPRVREGGGIIAQNWLICGVSAVNEREALFVFYEGKSRAKGIVRIKAGESRRPGSSNGNCRC